MELPIGVGITQLNFVGTGNTFKVDGTTIDISIEGGGGGGAGSTAGTISTGAVFSNPQEITDNDLDLTEPSIETMECGDLLLSIHLQPLRLVQAIVSQSYKEV